MLNEELKDQILQTKLTYLNAYLDALELINSYSVIGMSYKLFAFNFSAGNIHKAIQDNSYELFGVYPNDWEFKINECKNWKEKLESELKSNFNRRNYNSLPESELVKDLKHSINSSIDYFINLLKNEFAENSYNIYELSLTKASFYRIVGIDLIFEIDNTKIIFLQIIGSD
ncbi:hypothetical protein ABHQ57_06750 [Tenacibaculum sp. ZH5_bin.1]|uniref:hypothetical protein n=1 Tax=Tenacibaculum TaxID=104267 RepID=UPI0012E50950|nr:hypothetical protein [Tenacibaculum mesophilum]KAF9660139.1 hypothetical protein HBA12_07855 [Tenacibaculum mesophilum]GFD81174.1 hypothetical protein KUL118_40360 [Tenacibaculum sp. KUL118]